MAKVATTLGQEVTGVDTLEGAVLSYRSPHHGRCVSLSKCLPEAIGGPFLADQAGWPIMYRPEIQQCSVSVFQAVA